MKTNEFKEIVDFHKDKYRSSKVFWEAIIRELEYKGFLTTDKQVEVDEEFLGYSPQVKMPEIDRNVEMKVRCWDDTVTGRLTGSGDYFSSDQGIWIYKDNVEYWRVIK